MKRKVSQGELADIRACEEQLRKSASLAASSEVEPGDLSFSRDAYAQLARVPALVQRKTTSTPSVVRAAKRNIRAAGKRFANDGEGTTLYTLVGAVASVLLRVLGAYVVMYGHRMIAAGRRLFKSI